MVNILYFGNDSPHSTSFHRANALNRLGYCVKIYNPSEAIASQLKSPILSPLHYRTGYRFVQKRILEWLAQIISQVKTPEIIWVNSGELLGKKCLQFLRRSGSHIVLYNNDDPTGTRDGHRFDSLLKALAFYDLCVVLREVNISEYQKYNANDVMRVSMSYDEVEHQPFSQASEIPEHFRSEVAFVGTWMRHEKRDRFLWELIERGVPISIWGKRWQKSTYWQKLEPYYRGGALGGRNYVAAIQGAKVCLGFLSKGNRDLHTRRSVEIPYAGGLLCAERTSEHQKMYQEGREAVFWSNEEECATVCHQLLSDDTLRKQIRAAGMRRVRELRVGNEDICRKIIDTVKTI